MSEDILDRIHAHFRGQTFYEGRKPTLLEDAAAEIESLRAKLAEAMDEQDVWDFYFNHHLNTGGVRCFVIDSPLGMQWSVLTRWREDDEWERREGPGDRKDWPEALDAARECRRIAYLRGDWGSSEDHEDAIDAAMAEGEGG